MKKVISKLFILIIVFVLIVLGLFFINRDKSNKDMIIMGEPTLPTATFMASGSGVEDGDIEVNELYGYTSAMETKYMRDSITPINGNRNLVMRIKNNSNMVLAAEFEVRSLDCQRLVENTEVAKEDIVSDGDYTNVIIQIDNMISENVEYYLTVKLKTDRHESVYFYTRICNLTVNHCKEQIEFANNFSNCTFSDTDANQIISYIEPNPSQDNTNFGNVTINSSFRHITWGELKPEKVTAPVVKILDIIGDVGCYELDYKIRAKNEYDTDQYYHVSEYFRIKWTTTELYLLDYQRKVNQIFDDSNQNISAYRINLGIAENNQVEYRASENNNYIAFVRGNGLWMMDIGKNQIHPLFSFEEVENADIRDAHKENGIQIVSVDDNGNTEFIVFGYMNRGEHEGMVGVSLYKYLYSKNIVEERIFIPFTRQYEILKETIGKLSYVNDKNVMFLMLNDSVFSIDLAGSEYVQVISNLREGGYAVNSNASIIAWETDGDGAGASKIRILDFENNKEYELNADEGNKLKVLGFVDDDLCYGNAKIEDIIRDQNGNVTVAMESMKIINMNGEQLKEYKKEGLYISSVEISSNMINLKRLKRDENGAFVKADDYQVFGNEEEDVNVVSVDTISTDLKKTEYVLKFVKKVTSSNPLKEINLKEIRFSEENALSIRELISDDDKYYVYGRGGVALITTEVADAVKKADEIAGVVTKGSGDYVWQRLSRPMEYSISGLIPQTAAQEENGELAACLKMLLEYNGSITDVAGELAAGKNAMEILNGKIDGRQGYDLTGCSFTEMLYYVCKGQPVMGQLNGNHYVLIVGYDFYNAVLFDPATGTTYKNGQEETTAMFEEYGNKFFVVY